MYQLLRYILFPVSFIYGAIVALRNYLYDIGYYKSHKFKIPIILIGNLAVGGAGKSPMTEYIAALLKKRYKIAILSRGYGRKTKGFLNVDATSNSVDVGDEPLQFKQKFPDITVAVCEDRVAGIKILKEQNEAIILDDAYQHRAVKAGLNILLFDYGQLFAPHWLLPSGNLREPLSQRKRADILVATKCPPDISDSEQLAIKNHLKPFPSQQLFFSYISYGDLKSINSDSCLQLKDITSHYTIFLLTGIANAKPLVARLQEQTKNIIHHQYADHHVYSTKNIAKLVKAYVNLNNALKIIITTEKDAQRLKTPALQELFTGLPVYCLPVKALLHNKGEKQFNQIIENYVAQ